MAGASTPASQRGAREAHSSRSQRIPAWGRSKTASETFVVPVKNQKDPVLEYSFDAEHEAAIFSGAVA